LHRHEVAEALGLEPKLAEVDQVAEGQDQRRGLRVEDKVGQDDARERDHRAGGALLHRLVLGRTQVGPVLHGRRQVLKRLPKTLFVRANLFPRLEKYTYILIEMKESLLTFCKRNTSCF